MNSPKKVVDYCVIAWERKLLSDHPLCYSSIPYGHVYQSHIVDLKI